MTLQVETKTLKEALDLASKALAVKATNPILENFLLHTEENTLSVLASDGYTSVRKEINIIKGEGYAVFPPILAELIRTIETDTITINTDATQAVVDYGIGTASIPVFDPKDYPDFAPENGEEVEIDAQALAGALDKTLPFVATDELRPVLTGVYFLIKERGIDAVASDGHALSKCEIPTKYNKKEFNFIAPAKALSIVRGNLAEGTVHITATPKNINFGLGDTTIICRIIEGKFPNYESVIPKEFKSSFKTNKEKLSKTLKRISTTSDKASPCTCFTLTATDATIESKSLTAQTSAKESIEDRTFTGEDITIGFNAKVISRAVSATEGEDIEILFTEPKRAAVVQGCQEQNLVLVMPVQL